MRTLLRAGLLVCAGSFVGAVTLANTVIELLERRSRLDENLLRELESYRRSYDPEYDPDALDAAADHPAAGRRSDTDGRSFKNSGWQTLASEACAIPADHDGIRVASSNTLTGEFAYIRMSVENARLLWNRIGDAIETHDWADRYQQHDQRHGGSTD